MGGSLALMWQSEAPSFTEKVCSLEISIVRDPQCLWVAREVESSCASCHSKARKQENSRKARARKEIRSEKAGLTASAVECMKRFIDLLGRVFRCHGEAYAAGSVRNGRRANRGSVDAVSAQAFG